MRLGDILREHRTPKSIRRIICLLHRFFLRLETSHHHKRSEDFFAVNIHAILDAREDRRFDEKAFAPGYVFIRRPAHG